MKKYLLIILFLGVVLAMLNFNQGSCPLRKMLTPRFLGQETLKVEKDEMTRALDKALLLLKARKDSAALEILEKIILIEPENIQALWGKAEILRRNRNFKQAQEILNKILSEKSDHAASLISLSYIDYKHDRLSEAMALIKQALKIKNLSEEDKALAYMMLGSINSRRSAKGWIFSKIHYGLQIKGYFLKAKKLAPDSPEVHLSLGTFYLLAPAIVGGDLDKAGEELSLSVKMAPEFATANARLAQWYKKKGDLEKYDYYLKKAKILDSANEVVYEESRN
jgi:tetratricopeptide (TPR) repeat protein